MVVHYLAYPHRTQPAFDAGPYSLAIGFFDGVHLGHQSVIQAAIDTGEKLGLKTAVMTFDPHPSIVLGQGKKRTFYITPLQQKLEILSDLGVDDIFVVRFTSELSKLSPEEFVKTFIKGLNVKHVTAGFDYSFGAFGKGNMETMEQLSDGLYGVTVIEKQVLDDEKISSTQIRNLLTDGDFEKIHEHLGRPYRIDGYVVHGEKRGRQIGFPTANIQPQAGSYIPKTGIYAVRMFLQDEWYDGVCSVGYNPTFNNPDVKDLTIEVNIIDFDRSIYGEEVKIEWYKRFRDELKFSSVEELIEEIQKDKDNTIAYFQSLR